MSVTLRTFKARKPLNECFRLLLYQFQLFQKVLNIPFFFFWTWKYNTISNANIHGYLHTHQRNVYRWRCRCIKTDKVFQFANLKLHIIWNILLKDITKQGRNNNEHLMWTLNSSQKNLWASYYEQNKCYLEFKHNAVATLCYKYIYVFARKLIF